MMRRSPMKRSRRKDPVPNSLRLKVLLRDGRCVLNHLESAHECRDAWGTPHDPHQLSRLSIEHVKSELAMGKRAPSDEEHLVALCYAANVGVPSKAQRAAMRDYLRELYPVMA